MKILIKCKICGKEYSKKGIDTHIWRTHGDGKNHNSRKNYIKGSQISWNKGLTKNTDDRVKKSSETQIERFNKGEILPSFFKHTKEAKEKISIARSLNNKGGRCKWYPAQKNNGDIIRVQGTWELRFSKILNIIDENWIKPTTGNKKCIFKWIDDEGIKHTYTPDFYSPKLKKYFEIKGYWWGNDKRKMELVLEQNNINIEIIQKKELVQYEKLIGNVTQSA